ncbi:BTAD domain-containing putative transcriptional regulator [Streptomyces sp. NPDC015346]|uniref:AfsR/SARP family transcriptional regulator n=1 Tax=Streptomyces sp. NPDC015346 TaxID=3364954 RepID=UPI00370070B4
MSDPQHRLALHLLGPLRIWHDDRELAVGPPKQRAVLALLAGHRGTVVSREQIVDALWGADAPASAANAVHTYVAGLRRILEPERGSRESGAFIVSRAGGYELRVPAEAVDSLTFVRRYEEARALASAGRATAAFERFASALGLWRGEALSGIPGPYAALERTRLREMRVSATEGWIAGLIAAGRHEAAVVACSEAIAQEPLHERLRHLHMLALARSGRQAHAIQAYDDARRHLREELGIDPGPELRDLHERILAGDIAIDTPPPVTRPGTYPGTYPATPPLTGNRNPLPRVSESPLYQLPATARVFVGRESELQLARRGLARENSPRGSTAAILTVDGPAGVGKTAFALELAHEYADVFPDGQLYVDLRATDDDGPRSPGDALGRLLQGLGVEADRLPHDLEGRIALYRGLTRGRRMLLLLDDADHAGQLRPLVPSGPSAVIVTSRRLQRGLVAREGARRIGLRPLDPRAAGDLFVSLAGPERCAGQRDAVELIAEYCGRLPLGIRIAVGAMAANPYLSPRELAERYADPRTRLDQLSVEDDGASSVRRALAASYLALGDEEARFFRALGSGGAGAGPGAGAGTGVIRPAAAAAFTGGDAVTARRRLEALADVGLLERSGSDTYRFNELVAIYAAERATAERMTADRVTADRVTAAGQAGARPTQLLTAIRSDGFQGFCRPEALARR